MTYYGIYKITNKVNGKMYIGQHITDDLDDGYLGSGLVIKNAVKKYGPDSFTKEWLEFAENAEDLNYLERIYVDEEWLARPDTYNLALGGVSHRPFGVDTRELISVRTREAMRSPKLRKHLSNTKKGKPPWNKGKKGLTKWSDSQREKMHEFLSKPRPWQKGRPPWNKGKKLKKEEN